MNGYLYLSGVWFGVDPRMNPQKNVFEKHSRLHAQYYMLAILKHSWERQYVLLEETSF